MAASRRNVLTLLGLVGPASVALAADDLTNQDTGAHQFGDGKRIQEAKYDPERVAIAFEKLAKEVRAKSVLVSRFHIGSDVIAPDWLQQTLSIDLEVLIDPD